MERKHKILFYIIFGICTLLAAYILIAAYFWSRFAPNVWFNGIYCTGMTPEEVEKELTERDVLPEKFVITGYVAGEEGCEKGSQDLLLADISYSTGYLKPLKEKISDQIPWQWIGSLAASKDNVLSPDYYYDTEKLFKRLGSMTLYTQADIPEDYYIRYEDGGQGYTLYNGVVNRLDMEEAARLIREALEAGELQTDLIEGGCYYDVPLTQAQEQIKNLWEKVSYFQENGPSYDFEEENLRLTASDMASFLRKKSDHMPLVDGTGAFLLDEAAVGSFVDKIADQYDTYKKEWSFASTRGDTVAVSGATYGGVIDREAETLWLTEYLNRLLQGERIPDSEKIHIPSYQQKPYFRGKNSVGPTYIEVDMTEQKLYYYEDGKMTMETDVVTGSVKQRRNTPEGVNFVYGKQQNRTLRGPGYATFVRYWMPVNGNIGLHDASWRKEFGGDIYLTDGSHGCVNLPADKASELYQEVEIGTPVVMFY